MKRMVMYRWLRPVLALVAAAAPGAGCGGSSSHGAPDAGTPDLPDAGMSDAGMSDGPVTGPTGSVRFLNASPLAGSLDVYLHGQTSPVMSGVPYGAASDPVALAVGTIQLDVRPAGAPATAAPAFVSDPIAIADHGSITAIGAGLPVIDPLNPPPATSAFRITTVQDAFAAAAPGRTRVRVFDAMYSLSAVAVDLGDDASAELASLARFTASDAAGLDVAAGSELVVGVVNTDAAHTRVGTFVVPAAALGDGANVYLVVGGLSTFPPRDPRGALVIATAPPGGGAARVVRPNPVIYWLAASPDAAGIDGYLGAGKAFANLAFGKLASSVVPATAGATLDLRPAGADPASTPLASLATGALAAGQQYLAVVTGLASPASAADALALHVYRDDMLVSNDFFRMRIIHAATGAGTIDAGRFATGETTWVDMPEFDAIMPGESSIATGTALSASGTTAPIALGARPTSDPTMALRFASLSGLNSFDRVFGVLAGAWLPTGHQAPARYIIVKTAAISPWSTTVLSAVPDALAVTPTAATVTVGGTQQYAATAVFGNGMTQDMTAAASWSALDATIVQMSTTTRGLATGTAAGATTIKAELEPGAVTGTAALAVTAVPILAVSAIQPGDGATGIAAETAVSVAFSSPIAPASLVAQTADGPCSGTLQLSADGFATCVGLGAPALDATGRVATVQPATALATQTTYRLRVLGTVTSTSGLALGADFTQATGFMTTCPGRLVISQVYGGGSAAGGIYRSDFIELHNSGGAPVDLTGYAVQGGGATLATWTRQELPSVTLPPGGYFLIQEGGGTSMSQAALPDPDFIPATALNLNGMNHKVALSLSPTAFAAACPLTATPPIDVTDLVGYGATANCFEGAAPVSSTPMTNSTAALRNGNGCVDGNDNNNDFTVVALTAGISPVPRNRAAPVHVCACPH